MGYQEEYLPMNAKNHIDYFHNRSTEILVVDGNADISIIEDSTPNLRFKITNTNYAKLELPRLYYLGYTIKMMGYNGESTFLNYKENQYGFIEMEANQEAIIEVTYENTTLGRVGNKISLFTVGLFAIYLIIKKEKTK